MPEGQSEEGAPGVGLFNMPERTATLPKWIKGYNGSCSVALCSTVRLHNGSCSVALCSTVRLQWFLQCGTV